MFITIHAAASTIIGKQVGNPVLAFILAFIFHFILDLIPHGDEHLGKKFMGFKIKERESFRALALYGSMDSVVLVFFLLFLFKNFDWANQDQIIWAIIGGIIPDFFIAFYKLTNFKPIKWFVNLHGKNHSFLVNKLKADLPLKYGMILQLFLISILIWLIYII